jgi:Flp pilus assembly protein TadD
MLSEINTESAFLKKAGYEISSKHKYLTALEKVNDKNYTEAGQILDEIKTSDDTFGSAFFLSGYIAYVARKYETAIESLRRACELEPENAAYLVSYGNACLKEKKYDDASQALKKAVEIKPDDASAWNNLAHSYIVSDKIDDAVMAFSKATELKPDFHEALHNLGLALGKLKRYEEAADAFTKAIAVKDDKHESMYNAACVYALLGKREGALSNLKAAIAIQPEYAAKAKKDKDFSSFKNDDEFNAITG